MDVPRGNPPACAPYRELLSAELDGELAPAERARLHEHLAGCPACVATRAAWQRLGRSVRVREAESIPYLVDTVVNRARPARTGRGQWVRVSLGWVAVVLLVQSVPALVLGDEPGAATHVARHIGAFDAALAIGLGVAALQPRRAYGLLPFAAGLSAALFVTTVFDVADGSRQIGAEAAHLAELVGVVLLWLLAGAPGWRRARPPRSRPRLAG
jgi:predicted anti-sigma-YlaC factor YlaD